MRVFEKFLALQEGRAQVHRALCGLALFAALLF